MNIDERPVNVGLTITALPRQLNAFTNFAAGNAASNCSMSDSFGPVKNRSTPSSGGASAMGFVASITSLPESDAAPIAPPTPALAANAATLPAVRLPIFTSYL